MEAVHEEDRSAVLLKFRYLNNQQAEEDFRNEAKLLKRLKSDSVVEIKGMLSLIYLFPHALYSFVLF